MNISKTIEWKPKLIFVRNGLDVGGTFIGLRMT